ncbi:uncharacterized protein Z518_10796 [Rhinocladiella mackenziei CBS 650.93]|uniref:Uncharacterized protein n=1 Tax=Rhinocladiella mackenziei CBS 650.93 TaxID=1442369 RepID=A0A0D2I284_9EURO|nr:uncharacterized protein Z518_10796 [Rhinocladiella mackenziei CBS 650.93]KIW99868.1 hypothetical protein Z518_10796 [Rhinocladiella mackenziei CBS 650.93]
MVLLTSSAVSVILSSSVVCMFTFLLFLSGYVLQQQTVRSLQEALRRPPERLPVPTLPPQFQNPDNETVSVALESPTDGSTPVVVGDQGADDADQFLESIQAATAVQDDNQAHFGDSSEPKLEPVEDPSNGPLPQRLAYILALLKPSDLCSTLLFAKQQRSASRLEAEPSIILLYPSTWETQSSPLHTSVLNFMREVQDLYGLLYHPVRIHGGWDETALLLGELQWRKWDYDQALYLRSPGMILDSKALDAALGSPNPRKSWAPLNPSSGDNPDLLLVTPKGLQSPRKEMRGLAISAVSHHSDLEEDGFDIENLVKDAAYVLFDGEDLGLNGIENEWYGNLVRNFDRGRKSVCAGSGILDDDLKIDLKRRL